MLVLAALLALAPATRPAERPRNLVVMIADGAGYNTLDATRFYTGEPLAHDGGDWLRVAVAPHALRGDDGPCEGMDPARQCPEYAYDAAKNYDAMPARGVRPGSGEVPGALYPRGFAGYEWNRDFRPDSANTMTALMTGVTTYPGAINVGGAGGPVRSLAEAAGEAGMAVGVVTSVPFNHATPAAAAGVHNESREDYHGLARDLFAAAHLTVIAGPNDPDLDDDAHARDLPDDKYLPADLWAALKLGTVADSAGRRWTLVRDRAAIQGLAEGETPDKLVIVPRAFRTLQQKRRSAADARVLRPDDDPPDEALPTLAEMTRAALNAVDDDADGFFLMVEGGAIDWAMHDNQLGRTIEEHRDFDAAVRAVAEYLDAGTNGHDWSNTLVIVTADHDHLLFGPDGHRNPYQPLVDRGEGELPGHSWLFDHHSNQLVPLFAKGAGADAVVALADGVDEAEIGGEAVGRGPYFHQAKLGAWLIGQVDSE